MRRVAMYAHTIDEVIEHLTDMILWSKENSSRLGYFPALYRKVTARVKREIESGAFKDSSRMNRLDVVFANRYLEAYEQYRECGRATWCWQTAFGATTSRKPMVLQHLLLGLNAHINLDLAIAAADVTTPSSIADLRDDFYHINDILYSLIDQVQRELAEVWPLFRFFDLAAGGFDEALTRFGLRAARDRAWKHACQIVTLPSAGQIERIEQLDKLATSNARFILRPGRIMSLTMLLIRASERQSIPRIIEILE